MSLIKILMDTVDVRTALYLIMIWKLQDHRQTGTEASTMNLELVIVRDSQENLTTRC